MKITSKTLLLYKGPEFRTFSFSFEAELNSQFDHYHNFFYNNWMVVWSIFRSKAISDLYWKLFHTYLDTYHYLFYVQVDSSVVGTNENKIKECDMQVRDLVKKGFE